MRVLLDANILYPAPIRDIFLQLATSGVLQAKWTADIHREWIEALLRNEPYHDRAALQRTRAATAPHRSCGGERPSGRRTMDGLTARAGLFDGGERPERPWDAQQQRRPVRTEGPGSRLRRGAGRALGSCRGFSRGSPEAHTRVLDALLQ